MFCGETYCSVCLLSFKGDMLCFYKCLLRKLLGSVWIFPFRSSFLICISMKTGLMGVMASLVASEILLGELPYCFIAA